MPPLPGTRGDTPARLRVTAVTPDGATVYRGKSPDVSLSSSIPIGGDAAPAGGGPPGASSTGPSKLVFDAPPGRIQLRYQVENEHAGIVDTSMQEVEVPDLSAPELQVTTPVVLRARTVKEFRDLSADQTAVPTPNREFRRTDRLIMRFEVFGPGNAMPKVTAKLLNRTGQPMSDVPLAGQPAGSGFQLDLPLAGMAAGEYLVEVAATTDAGSARQLVAFRITS
jgi:hypothetical protein